MSVRLLIALCAAVAGCADPAVDYSDPTAAPPAAIALQAVWPLAGAVSERPDPRLRVRLIAPPLSPSAPAPGLIAQLDGPPGAAARAFEPSDHPAATADEFEATLPLWHGDNPWRLVAVSGAQSATLRLDLRYEGDAPGLRLLAPDLGGAVTTARAPLLGLATAPLPARVVEVRFSVDGQSWAQAALRPTEAVGAAAADPASFHTVAFSAAVDWPAAGPLARTLRVLAIDDAGRRSEWAVPVRVDRQAPQLTVFEPEEVFTPATAELMVRGAAVDDTGVATVQVGLAGQALDLAEGVSPFEARLALPTGEGPQWIEIRALDGAGRSTSSYHLANLAAHVPLGPAQAAPSAPIDLVLDRAALESVLPDQGRDDITLLCLDLGEVVRAAVSALVDPASVGMDVSTWPLPAQNLQRLLAMTPGNADFSGTPLEAVMDLASGLGMAPSSLLGALLDLGPSEPFLRVSTLTEVLVERLVLTHPALIGVAPCDPGELGVTLADALSDMATLEAKLGPDGAHPGLVDGPPWALVLAPAVRMRLRAHSQLVGWPGLDLQQGAARLYLPPEGAPALTFSFGEHFALEGLPDYPRVSLPFRLEQAPGVVASGTAFGVGGVAPFFRGDSPAWSLPSPWWLEGVVIDAAHREYAARWPQYGHQRALVYALGALSEAAALHWDHGWLAIETAGGLGAPPPPAYLWDTLLDVVQVRLGDGLGPAAQTDPIRIPLEGVPMPITAAEVAAEVPERLEAQAAALSDLIAGPAAAWDTPVDILLLGDPAGASSWRVVDAALAPAKALHPQGGALYADAALTSPLGAERPVTIGEILYAVDEDGAVWALRALEAGPGGWLIEVSR